MPAGQMSRIFQHLPKTNLAEETPDAQLLLCFIDCRETAALEILVRRYTPMVWGVCRRILGNYHDAEDAFQATFLVLVRKASSIVPREMVGNWLYGVARQTALKVRTTSARRKQRESQGRIMPQMGDTENEMWDLLPLLDQELSGLPDRYRMAILLCDLEGKTRKEAARRIGCAEGTVATWLARGRLLLAKRLARRGVAGIEESSPIGLSQKARVYAPALVVASTLSAARLFAMEQAMPAAMGSTRVVALTKGVLKAMLLSKLKIAAVLLFVVSVVAGLGFTIQAQDDPRKPEAACDGPSKDNMPFQQVRLAPVRQQARPKEKPSPVAISPDNVKDLREVGALKRDANRFKWVPGSHELAVMPWEDEIEVFDARELKSIRKLAIGKRLVDFAFSPDGKYLAWAENNKSFANENLKTGKRELFDTDNDQPSTVFSPDSKWLASGGYGTEASLWEVATAKKIRDFETDAIGGLTPVFSPDGKILALGNRNSDPRLFETATGKLLHVLPKKQTQGIRFNPAGTILAIAYVDGSIGLWDVATGKQLREKATDGKELYIAEWNPKGDLLVTAGLEGNIILWDPKELKPLKELAGPEWVISAKFTPDGSRLFTAGGTFQQSPDRKITVWGLEAPKP